MPLLSHLLQSSINAWIRLTGKRIKLAEQQWLSGPIGGKVIGDRYYEEVARQRGLSAEVLQDGGLLDDFGDVIDPSDANGPRLNPKVRHFYEHSTRYKLEVWSQWYSFIRFFAHILIRAVSREINQLNIPLEPLETSHGMSSELIRLRSADGNESLTCWLRKSVKSGKVVYAGFYSAAWLPRLDRECVRVVFPLPKGSVTVLLRVDVQPDGSVILTSKGRRIGDAGYYRLQAAGEDAVRVKYIPLHESIHVYEDKEGVIRTDHTFAFWGIKFLHLHYKVMQA